MNNRPHEAKNWIHTFIVAMSGTLYKPGRRWFEKIILGALLACSTVSTWIRTVEEQRHYKKFYHHLSRSGEQTLVRQGKFGDWQIKYSRPVLTQDIRIYSALDDSPTKRFGMKIEGAERHHAPTSPNVKATRDHRRSSCRLDANALRFLG